MEAISCSAKILLGNHSPDSFSYLLYPHPQFFISASSNHKPVGNRAVSSPFAEGSAWWVPKPGYYQHMHPSYLPSWHVRQEILALPSHCCDEDLLILTEDCILLSLEMVSYPRQAICENNYSLYCCAWSQDTPFLAGQVNQWLLREHKCKKHMTPLFPLIIGMWRWEKFSAWNLCSPAFISKGAVHSTPGLAEVPEQWFVSLGYLLSFL